MFSMFNCSIKHKRNLHRITITLLFIYIDINLMTSASNFLICR